MHGTKKKLKIWALNYSRLISCTHLITIAHLQSIGRATVAITLLFRHHNASVLILMQYTKIFFPLTQNTLPSSFQLTQNLLIQ